ncbi:hypothetical protein HUO12_10065 [Altererythrobacter sp. JGD-16]|uniref:Porin n=2 Tax=Altererythrobacter lutimaris TaxID=2743979 RepID=A0A850HB21_9SPHN|nr:hypothetical protein [Altererythrobacter lutimaris]
MPQRVAFSGMKRRNLPLIAAACALAFGVPNSGMAVASLADGAVASDTGEFPIFTPASVDPALALRVAERAGQDGMRFTPAETSSRDRTVTVAVRVDDNTARAISLRKAIDNVPSASDRIAAITPTRYNLGISRGYQSFAKPVALPNVVRNVDMPDLAEYSPSAPTAEDKPSRFQPRIALEGNSKVGRSVGTFEALGNQSVDLGGAYSITRNLDVTAGVRLSQERDRLAPLTDSAQDSQAVYVGTQFRF